MTTSKVKGQKVQTQQDAFGKAGNNLIDFDKFHSTLRVVNLLNCQGSVIRVSGLTVESSGPKVGLGELCGINICDGRRILAEVVGFHGDRLILLPLEHIEGISPGDTVY